VVTYSAEYFRARLARALSRRAHVQDGPAGARRGRDVLPAGAGRRPRSGKRLGLTGRAGGGLRVPDGPAQARTTLITACRRLKEQVVAGGHVR